MFTHPYIGSKLHHDRHRDMLADVRQHRLAGQLRAFARASRRAGRTPTASALPGARHGGSARLRAKQGHYDCLGPSAGRCARR